MENLILITAHCPTEEQEKLLEECIDSVLQFNYHILLVSHTHIPIHIQKKCKYYFYDYLNDINYDDDLLYYVYYYIKEGFTIKSKYFTKEFYGFAIYRMFSIAAQVARNFGYRNIHHIEYDCRILDNTLIDYHNELLKTYDSVMYTNDGQSSGFLFGAFKSFRVDKLPDLFMNYNKEKIREIMVNVPLKPLENFTKQIFSESGNVYFGKSLDLVNNNKFFQANPFLRKKSFTPYYNDESGKFELFFKNIGSSDINLRIYVNGNSVIQKVIRPTWWEIFNLCNEYELKSLLIISNGDIIYDKTFTNEEKVLLKKNSFVDRS